MTQTVAKKHIDVAEVRKALNILAAPSQVTELRILDATTQSSSRYPYTASGYFNDPQALTKELTTLRTWTGVYITLQPCKRELLARAQNRLRSAEGMKKDKSTTADNHILQYRWLLIDCDPERPAGISSSDEEHEAALAKSEEIQHVLRRLEWPEPVRADSGNGGHLLYRVDLPVTDAALIQRVLVGLAGMFDSEGLHIDLTVFNPSRISKLYGTLACKGDDTDERPHRMSRILETPDTLNIVPRATLEAMTAPEQPRATNSQAQSFDIEQFIQEHHLDVNGPQSWNGGDKWVFNTCPWNSEHTDHSAYILRFASGAIAAGCHHNGCYGRDWKDLRQKYEPGKDKKAPSNVQSMQAGMQSPRAAPAPDPQTQTAASTSGGGSGSAHITANGLGELPDASVDFVLSCLSQNEWGDSLLFAHLFQGKTVYDHTEKEWYLWHKHYWKRDEIGRIKHFVSGLLASVYLQTAAIIAKDTSGDDEQEKQRKKKIQALYARALEIRGLARCKNVLTFSSSHLGINASQWDTNKWLLAVPNGVIDLKTGLLRDGKSGDYIRTVCPTEWQGLQAPAHRWEQFLQEIFEDWAEADRAQLIDFLARLFGYGITGETREHIFAVLYGEDGRNGKDTLQRAISYALGQASGGVSKDVLLDSGKQHTAGAATPHLSDLQGKRLAWASEPEKGARFNIGQVKELSGGGDITTRSPYEKRFYTFTPTHLLVLLTNHKPHADANDSAFWDRLRLIIFNMRFVDKPQEANERKRDVTLWDALEQEAPGILAWLVRGCLAWQRAGLATPQFITQAGQEYRKEEDTIGQFVDECCIIAPDAEALAGRVYTAYSTWCSDGNMRPLNSTNFGRLFSKRFRKEKQRQGVTYYGVGLRDANLPDPDESVNSSKNYSQSGNTTLQADLEDTEASEREQCEGFLQKVSNPPILATPEISFSDKTIHTIHSQSIQNGMNSPDMQSDGTVKGFKNYSQVSDCMTVFEGLMNTSHGQHEATLHDRAGGTWCDNCIWQHDLMNIGHERGYPPVRITHMERKITIKAGEQEWLQFAKTSGYKQVQGVLSQLEAQP